MIDWNSDFLCIAHHMCARFFCLKNVWHARSAFYGDYRVVFIDSLQKILVSPIS